MRVLKLLLCFLLIAPYIASAENTLYSERLMRNASLSVLQNSPLVIDTQDIRATSTVLLNVQFVDRSDPFTLLKEERCLELLRLWQNNRARIFFGIGPTGFAGLNFTSRHSYLNRKPKDHPSDLDDTIRELSSNYTANNLTVSLTH